MPLLFAATLAVARPENITAGELALTPPFCQDAQSINGWTKEVGTRSPRAEHWLSLMGESFWHMHHFCWGLIQWQRAHAPGVVGRDREFLLREAINEHLYVVRNTRPDYVMLPEIFYRIGEAQAALGEHYLAIQAFEKSRAVKNDYWPAYVGWARSLASSRRPQEALAVVEDGLRVMPDNPQLSRLAKELRGETPRPNAVPVRR
ncbi:MAG: hypothetical protein JNL85_18540 [Rubrivivax sp.]|nr:hypothetical protein [Rubrivivax sp.]